MAGTSPGAAVHLSYSSRSPWWAAATRSHESWSEGSCRCCTPGSSLEPAAMAWGTESD